jgi:hypothetical protein
VLAVLNHINGNAARLLVSSKQLTSDVTADLRAIYNDPLYAIEIRVAEQGVTAGFANVRRPPGDRVTSVTGLVATTKQCIFVQTRSDLTAIEVTPTAPAASEYWELRPKQAGIDPRNVNPTPWALGFNEAFLKPTILPNQCSAS